MRKVGKSPEHGFSYAKAHQDGPADEIDLGAMLGEHGPDLTLSEAEVLSMQVLEIRQQLQRILLCLEEQLLTKEYWKNGETLTAVRAVIKRIITDYC